jgi:hypothetical protein
MDITVTSTMSSLSPTPSSSQALPNSDFSSDSSASSSLPLLPSNNGSFESLLNSGMLFSSNNFTAPQEVQIKTIVNEVVGAYFKQCFPNGPAAVRSNQQQTTTNSNPALNGENLFFSLHLLKCIIF